LHIVELYVGINKTDATGTEMLFWQTNVAGNNTLRYTCKLPGFFFFVRL